MTSGNMHGVPTYFLNIRSSYSPVVASFGLRMSGDEFGEPAITPQSVNVKITGDVAMSIAQWLNPAEICAFSAVAVATTAARKMFANDRYWDRIFDNVVFVRTVLPPLIRGWWKGAPSPPQIMWKEINWWSNYRSDHKATGVIVSAHIAYGHFGFWLPMLKSVISQPDCKEWLQFIATLELPRENPPEWNYRSCTVIWSPTEIVQVMYEAIEMGDNDLMILAAHLCDQYVIKYVKRGTTSARWKKYSEELAQSFGYGISNALFEARENTDMFKNLLEWTETCSDLLASNIDLSYRDDLDKNPESARVALNWALNRPRGFEQIDIDALMKSLGE